MDFSKWRQFAVSTLFASLTFPALASTGGIDTPTNVVTLPLAVQGTTGCTLRGQVNAAIKPDMDCDGAIQAGPVTTANGSYVTDANGNPIYTTSLNSDGTVIIGSNNAQITAGSAPVLTINGTTDANGLINAGPIKDANGNVTGYVSSINADGTTTIGSTANAAGATPSANPVLTLKGGLAIMGVSTVGSDCSATKLGTVAQDGTGKLLSCQSTAGNNGQTFYTWQSALGGTCSSAQIRQALAKCTRYPDVPQTQQGINSLVEGQLAYYDWVGPACQYGSANGPEIMQCLNGQVIPVVCGTFITCASPPPGG